jgi:Ca2+/Na+ antiporter
VNIVYFTLLAALLYLFSDWLLQRVEIAVGRRLEHRSLVFFVVLLALALTSFSLIGNLTGAALGRNDHG